MPWYLKGARLARLAVEVWWPWLRHFPIPTITATAVMVALVLVGIAGAVTISSWFLLVVLAAVPVSVGVWVWLGWGSWARVMGGDGGGTGNPLSVSVGAWLRFRFPIEAANSDLTQLIRGRLRAPLLEVVTVDGAWLEPRRWWLGRWSVPWFPVLVVGTVSMVIKPLAQHRPDIDWPELARRLQVRFDFAAHSTETVGANRLRANFATRELASYAPFDPVEWLEAIESEPRSIVYGPSGHVGGDRWVRRHLDRAVHSLTAGTTGGGKSTPLRLSCSGHLHHGARLIVLNGKRSAEFTWLRDSGLGSVVSTPFGWWAAVMWFAAESARRQELLERDGVEAWADHPDLDAPVAMVIDEVARVTGSVGVHPFPDLATETTLALADAAATVRSAGAHIDMATQYGLAQVFGNSVGSLTRFNLAARIIVGASSRDGLKVAFDLSEEIDATVASYLAGRYPGRCLYRGLGGDESHLITRGQIWHCTQADALAIAPSEPVHPVIDFDRLGLEVFTALTDVSVEGSGRNARRVRGSVPEHLDGLDVDGFDVASSGRGRAVLAPFVPWLQVAEAFHVPPSTTGAFGRLEVWS